MEKIFYLTTVLIVSCLNNLLIPYFIYYRKFGLFKKRKNGFIGVNFWGIIMDGVLAGLINMITFNFLLETKIPLTGTNITISLLSGCLFMVICHIYMSVKKWKIWIMPKPWHWNEAGYWHMISMTIQMAYIAYCLIVIFTVSGILAKPITVFTVMSCLLLGALFALVLKIHPKGLRIGKLYISNKAW